LYLNRKSPTFLGGYGYPRLYLSNFSPIVSKRFRSVTYGFNLSTTCTIGEIKVGKAGGVATASKKNYSEPMSFLGKVNFNKLFWVTTAILSIVILLLPVDDNDGWIVKLSLILITPFLVGGLALVIGVIELLWEALSPLLKSLKMWFLK
jgi:hypothetical protein